MSFILDALKKSENDRQRQSGPALFEVRVAAPRSRVPLWAIGVAGLIAINLSVIGWLMLRKPATAASPPLAAAATPAATNAPMTAQSPPLSAPPVATAGVPQPAPVYPPPAAHITAPPIGASSTGAPPTSASPTGVSPQAPATNFGVQGAEPALSDERPSPAEINPDDYAPANPSTSTGLFGGHVTRGLESGLPTYEEAASKTTIPPLHLDLHVYAPDPRKRFVLVNMKRMYEGDSLPDGVKVDSITTEGAVLSFRGTRFVLERE